MKLNNIKISCNLFLFIFKKTYNNLFSYLKNLLSQQIHANLLKRSYVMIIIKYYYIINY